VQPEWAVYSAPPFLPSSPFFLSVPFFHKKMRKRQIEGKDAKKRIREKRNMGSFFNTRTSSPSREGGENRVLKDETMFLFVFFSSFLQTPDCVT